MVKLVLIVTATAVFAFAAGIWAEASLSEHPGIETRIVRSTISPFEMHHSVKHHDLPVQHMQGEFN